MFIDSPPPACISRVYARECMSGNNSKSSLKRSSSHSCTLLFTEKCSLKNRNLCISILSRSVFSECLHQSRKLDKTSVFSYSFHPFPCGTSLIVMFVYKTSSHAQHCCSCFSDNVEDEAYSAEAPQSSVSFIFSGQRSAFSALYSAVCRNVCWESLDGEKQK